MIFISFNTSFALYTKSSLKPHIEILPFFPPTNKYEPSFEKSSDVILNILLIYSAINPVPHSYILILVGNIFLLILAFLVKYSIEGTSINYLSDISTNGK